MVELELQQAPNQSFSFTNGGHTFDITLKTCAFLIADVSIDGELIIAGVRVMAYRPIVPYHFMTAGSGNFFLVTNEGEKPNYTLFGLTQTLYYMTDAEIGALNVY